MDPARIKPLSNSNPGDDWKEWWPHASSRSHAARTCRRAFAARPPCPRPPAARLHGPAHRRSLGQLPRDFVGSIRYLNGVMPTGATSPPRRTLPTAIPVATSAAPWAPSGSPARTLADARSPRSRSCSINPQQFEFSCSRFLDAVRSTGPGTRPRATRSVARARISTKPEIGTHKRSTACTSAGSETSAAS